MTTPRTTPAASGAAPAGTAPSGAGRRTVRRRHGGSRPTGPGPFGWRVQTWQLKFAALALMWGMSFLFMKVADESLAPLQVALGRMIFGALALGTVLAIRRERLPGRVRIWAHLALVALLLNAVPFSLFAYAEQRIPSALAGIGNGTTPLFTTAFAVLALRSERPDRRRVLGVATGFIGLLVVFGVWRGVGGGDAAGTLMAVAAAACYGLGWVYVRRFLTGTGYSTLALAAGQLIAGTVLLAVVTCLATGAPAGLPVRVVGSVVLLGVFGTGIAYLLQYQVIGAAGATVASTVTYFVPVVALLVGIGVLGEHLSWNVFVGAAVILAGAALTQRQPASRAAAPPAAATGAAPVAGTGDR